MPTLEFKGKASVYAHHLSVPFRELVVQPGKSLAASGAKPSLDDNLIIHGDNLEALKALLPRYAGKVDVIYIDPPYNTGNEGWAYNDNVNSPLMKGWLGKAVDREDLERHDKWLCMMWPRLELLRELLADDGVLLVSIDDEEFHHLRAVLDEIFGEQCFVAQLVWKSRTSEDTRAKNRVSKDHEYVLVYSRTAGGSLKGVEKDETKFSNSDDDPRGPWRSADLTGLATKDRRPNLHYDLIDPDTRINYGCPPKGWRYERPTMQKKIAEKRILWPLDASGRPRHKLFLKELHNKLKNISSVVANVGTEHGTREVNGIVGEGVFDFPKPTDLLATLIEQAGSDDSIVLDAFAGSGSTAHAVLKLNAQDEGTRSFVLVQMPEPVAEGTPAHDHGFRQVVDITAERIRRVIGGGQRPVPRPLEGSFTYCELGEPIDLERFFQGKAAPPYAQVARYIVYTATGLSITETPEKPDDLWFVGEAGGYRIHLIYKPDLAWMKSGEAALTEQLAQRIAKAAASKPALVYGAQKFMGQKALRDIGVTFCQMPYSIYRILGNGDDA